MKKTFLVGLVTFLIATSAFVFLKFKENHGHVNGSEHKDEHGDEHGGEHKDEHGGEHKDEHGDEHKDEHGGEHKDEHGDEHGGEQKDEHGHAEENSSTGEGKGIIKADEENGFVLSEEAKKNFSIKTIKVINTSSIRIPKTAILYSLEEKNIYRVRKNFIKRIDFQILSSDSESFVIKSPDLSNSDEVIITSIGFVRITEITAFGGNADGHAH